MKSNQKRNLVLVILFLFIAGIGITSEADAQEQTEEYRRIGLSVQAGITMPDKFGGLQFFRSDLNRKTVQTTNFGAGIEYALIPFWSLGAQYGYTTVEGDVDPFETQIHSLGLKNFFNFNRLYADHRLSEVLNPFATFGFGYDFFNYESPNVEFSDTESYLSFGLGLGVFVSEGVELFGQVDYHLGSNQFDNKRERYYRSLLTKPSAGIRIHFGQSGTKRLSSAPSRGGVPESVRQEMRQELNTTEEQLRNAEQKAEQQQEEIARLQQELEAQKEQYEERLQETEDCCNELEKLKRTQLEVEFEGELTGVNFAFDSSELLPDARPILNNAVRLLRTHPDVDVEIQGHTDSVGTEEYNQNLSQRRAESVRQYLISQGISADRLSTVGYGESQPITTNETPEGQAMNRRVVLIILD